MVQSMVDVAAQPPQCDRDCSVTAVYAYLWDWGEKGVCCAQHATLLQQTSAQINRGVTLHPLVSAAPAPLQRDERTRLNASILTLEAELNEAKSRGLELYRVNGDLVRQVQTLTTQKREADAQLKDLDAHVIALQGQLDERDAEHAELTQELARLRTLEALVAPAVNPAPSPEETSNYDDELPGPVGGG